MVSLLRRLCVTIIIVPLLLSTIYWVPLSSPARAQGNGIDLALVINGSGSISAADFTLQKEGIKAAFRDSRIFPRNGSIAVTLVQYAGYATQVHIPYTVVSSEADINNLITQTDAVVQIGGATNPGDGINTAMGVLNGSGDQGREQTICLSTDGLPNAGADVATALNNAKASSIGLERFSVVAIEDPPFYFEADFQAFYGPLVFGGGAVTVVRNSAEYANILGATCLAPELELIGLEVNQAIQDWSDSVQVIENKTTYVRAHIQTKGQASAVAVARLRGFRDGSELPDSPLTAVNTGGSIVVDQNAIARRANLGDSLNFRLPPSWLNGTVDLRVEGVGGGLDCSEAADSPNDCGVQVTFNQTDALEVLLVAINWADSQGTDHNPSAGTLTELEQRLIAIYPVADISFEAPRSINWAGTVPPDLKTVNDQLETMRMSDGCTDATGCNRLYYGVLEGVDLGGLANGIPGVVASGYRDSEPNVHAHEIGHLLLREHANFCGAGGGSPFPYSATLDGETKATIGPMTLGEDRLIFGLDTRQMMVLNPFQNFELMSYCVPLWISDFTYDGIRIAINSLPLPVPVPVPTPPPTPFMLFRGTVNFDTNSAEFLPFSVAFSPVPLTTPPPGNYALELRDSGANLIQNIPFKPTVHHAFGRPDPGTGSFIIPVPANPAIEQAVVLRDGGVLTSRSASANPPTVQVIFPNGGEYLSGAQTVLEWLGEDYDGDDLAYTVQYSADGGNTWETLVVDWPDTRYEVNLESLKATSNGLIRIIASDGFDTEVDESDDPFTTPNNPPQVSILSPENGDQYVGVQPIFFEGLATDREEGRLSGSSLVWVSDRDGTLGTGEVFNLEATELTEGDHVITLIATDGGGLTDSASVNISVFRLAPPPPVVNQPPTADANGPYEGNEGAAITLDASGSSDPDDNIVLYEWDLDNDGEFDDATGVTTEVVFGDNGFYVVGLKVTDEFGESDTDTADVTVYNVAPEVTADPTSQGVQYSDYIADVTFTATDVPADTMTANTSWSVDGGEFTPGLQGDLALMDGGCGVSDSVNTCTWTLSGIANVASGTYTVRVAVADEDGEQTVTDIMLVVLPEDATVSFDAENPVAMQVAEPGGNSGPFSLTVYVRESQPDQPVDGSAPGDIDLASVSMSLEPVGPGGPVAGVCVPGTVTGSSYDAVLPVTCSFDGVAVNAYAAQVTVGGGYYTGGAEDVLTVYDPSLGFATGGGWFYWPGTDERTNFGFTMKYNKKGQKVKGNLLLIRHLPDGSIYRVKSNALYGLALGESPDPTFGWASFSGKSTYLEPGWPEPEGNHEFLVYVEDRDEPGTGVDRFWIEVKDKDREVVPALSVDREATDNAVQLSGGNIAVPHVTGGEGN